MVLPSWDRCCRLATAAIRAGGANLDTGTGLPSIFAAAGLPAPSLRMTTIVGAGTKSHDVLQRMANLIQSLRPRIEELGLANPAEIDELARRLPEDVAASASFITAGLRSSSVGVPGLAGTHIDSPVTIKRFASTQQRGLLGGRPLVSVPRGRSGV